MILCYNKIMELLIKILLVMLLIISPAKAVSFDVLVLPTDLLSTKENYYNFNEMSEIIANDIIKNFNNSNGKIKSPNLYEVRQKLNQNSEQKTLTQNVLNKFKTSQNIDYASLKKIGQNFSCKSVLLISSYVTTNKNSTKRGLWEVLEVSSDFDTVYPYRLETSIVLIDTVNDIVMWSNHYSTKLGNNENIFSAQNYVEANEWLKKMSLYSKTIIAPSASQNITLRFFPKAIRPIENKQTENTGGALKFDKTIPEKPQNKNKKDDDFFGEMIYGI